MHTQVPDTQLALSEKLIEQIQAAIVDHGGWVGFDLFMQMALYSPGLGYYSGTLEKFGEGGDFITAPEMGDLFGQALAGQVQQVLTDLGAGSVLEFGAGSGALAASVLNELARLGTLPDQYYILELSGELRDRQKQTLAARAGKYLSHVKWLDALPESFAGVVLANEVLDAMPVKLFEQHQDGSISELGVGVGEGRDACNETKPAFTWQLREADPKLSSAVSTLTLEVDHAYYRSEINFQAQAWIASLAEMLERGVILLIDYGFQKSEYYHPDRNAGTLMCHYQHRAHDDPFFLPGQQDITAHVDFSAVARAAQNAGLEIKGYASQGAFLLSAGLLDKIQLDAPVQKQILLAQQVKKLTMPHEMGELFKVLALSCDYAAGLSGFAQQNNAYKLESK